MSDLSRCPRCGYASPDGAWFTYVDLSICQKPDGDGARFEIRVSCDKCHRYIDWPGADFPGHITEGSYVSMPANKMLDLDKLVVDRVLDADKLVVSIGCTCIKNDCSICKNS